MQGGDVGARAAIDLWYEPTPGTMFAADGSVSTIINSYSARVVFGWRAFDLFYLGPGPQPSPASATNRCVPASI